MEKIRTPTTMGFCQCPMGPTMGGKWVLGHKSESNLGQNPLFYVLLDPPNNVGNNPPFTHFSGVQTSRFSISGLVGDAAPLNCRSTPMCSSASNALKSDLFAPCMFANVVAN